MVIDNAKVRTSNSALVIIIGLIDLLGELAESQKLSVVTNHYVLLLCRWNIKKTSLK